MLLKTSKLIKVIINFHDILSCFQKMNMDIKEIFVYQIDFLDEIRYKYVVRHDCS